MTRDVDRVVNIQSGTQTLLDLLHVDVCRCEQRLSVGLPVGDPRQIPLRQSLRQVPTKREPICVNAAAPQQRNSVPGANRSGVEDAILVGAAESGASEKRSVGKNDVAKCRCLTSRPRA